MLAEALGWFVGLSHMVKKVALTQATVLFLGESGVGKEIFSHNLHRLSKRAKAPFIAVNCAAIPEQLAESELFGWRRAALPGRPSRGPAASSERAGAPSFSTRSAR